MQVVVIIPGFLQVLSINGAGQFRPAKSILPYV